VEGIGDIQLGQIERRKERIRRAWDYRPVDHIPLSFFLDDFSAYSLRQQCESGELQYEVNVRSIDRLLRLLPDDYIPAARVWPGYITLATMFGLEAHWSDDPNQAPGVAGHLIRDMEQVYGLEMPERDSGLMTFNLRWLRTFAEKLPAEVSLTGIDLGGPVNTAKDLLETNLLYTAFYDSPEAFHHLLSLAAELQIRCYQDIVAAVGDIRRLTCIDFAPSWAPEGRKGFVSDDVCASYSPQIFETFSRPYNSRILGHWPGGRIHNCGPHPSLDLYLGHEPPLNGLNCSFRYTRGELPRIKRSFKGRAVVEFMFDNGESPEEILRGFEEIAAALAPDVIGIPIVWLTDSWTDEAIRELYHGLLDIAERYARQMSWRSDSSAR
jgi:uroporphyrinogen-III decarboxylase